MRLTITALVTPFLMAACASEPQIVRPVKPSATSLPKVEIRSCVMAVGNERDDGTINVRLACFPPVVVEQEPYR